MKIVIISFLAVAALKMSFYLIAAGIKFLSQKGKNIKLYKIERSLY